jgi:uncharacterized membrane protein
MPEDLADADLKSDRQPELGIQGTASELSTQESDAVSGRGDTEEGSSESGIIVAPTSLEVEEFSEIGDGRGFSVTTEMVKRHPQVVATSYEGPLPPPAFLRGYEELSPGAATEIISWVKDESQHRRNLELAELDHRRTLETEESRHRMRLETRAMDLGEKALNSGIARANAGMYLAWPLVIGIVAAGTYLIVQGHDTAGTFLVESALLIVVGAYILNRIVSPRGEKKPPESSDDVKKNEK